MSIVVLVPLAYLKRQTAASSAATRSRATAPSARSAPAPRVLALLGLVLNDAFGWWWADRVVALVIAAVAVIEACTLLTAEHADD